MEHAARAIHVATADRDYPARGAAEHVHQLACLAARAENQIDDDVGLHRAQGVAMRGERAPIAEKLARGIRRRVSAMERDHLVTAAIERGHDVRTDEARGADDQDTHAPIISLIAA